MKLSKYKYDDAVARLYRAVEIIAQMLLSRRNIESSGVKVDFQY